MYSFESIVACRGYHIYKDTTWQKTRVGEIVKVEVETNQNSTQIDPYACAIKVKNVFYDVWDTVGHIPREISRHTYFFLTEEGGQVCGTVMSVVYRSSPIPGGGLEIPLNLTFKCNEATTVIKMKNFVREMYDYNYLEKMDDDDEDDLCYRCYHFVTDVTTLLPLCYHFVTTLLPLCYHFVTTLLSLCYHFATIVTTVTTDVFVLFV